jgi:hypothetical protein
MYQNMFFIRWVRAAAPNPPCFRPFNPSQLFNLIKWICKYVGAAIVKMAKMRKK